MRSSLMDVKQRREFNLGSIDEEQYLRYLNLRIAQCQRLVRPEVSEAKIKVLNDEINRVKEHGRQPEMENEQSEQIAQKAVELSEKMKARKVNRAITAVKKEKQPKKAKVTKEVTDAKEQQIEQTEQKGEN